MQNRQSSRPARAGPPRPSRWSVYLPLGLAREGHVVPVASFPLVVTFWPAMLTFLVCGCLQRWTALDPTALGWWAYGVLAANLVVIVFDLDQKKALIGLLLASVLGLVGYLSVLQGSGLVPALGAWLASLQPTMATDLYFLLGGTLVVFTGLALLHPLFDHWRLEPNEFTHHLRPWGRDHSIPRLGSTVTREIPDLFEYALTFGGGTLVISRQGQAVARIERVPFLNWRMKAIERLLGVQRVKSLSREQ